MKLRRKTQSGATQAMPAPAGSPPAEVARARNEASYHGIIAGPPEAQASRRGITARLADAVGGFVGRISATADATRAEALAEKPTGRLDHTWSARSSTSSPAYEAGAQNRGNADWRTGLTSATLAIIESLDVMLARSRWQIRNDGYAASIQGGYRRKVVGGGITARASARHPETGEMLKEFNRQHDALWNAWALEPALCDVERTKCLYEKQALWMDELVAAGGVLLRAVYTPLADAVGLAIQEIEYEQLNRDLTSYGGNAVYNGIETDAYGAPVAYHVYAASHPLEEQPATPMRLPAGECWHLFRKGRVRQRLGVPMMAPVMPALRNLAMYELYTVSKARTEAAYHGIIEEPAAGTTTMANIIKRVGGKVPEGDTDDGQNLQVRVENGLFPILRGGQKVSFPPPVTPNTMYPAFLSENLKRIAAGTGLDLPTVCRWYADGNFNTQRKAALEIEAETEAIQDLQFINGGLRGIRNLWTDIAVMEGKLAATGYAQSARWKAAYRMTNWQGPPQRSVDPIKDQAAWDMKYRSLRGSPQEYCNEQGRDIRDLLSEWQEFVEMARDEYKLGPLLDQFFGTGTANAPKAGVQPDGSGGDSDPAAADPNAADPNAPRNQSRAAGGRIGGRLADLIASRTILDSVLDSGNGNGGGNGHTAGNNGHGRMQP